MTIWRLLSQSSEWFFVSHFHLSLLCDLLFGNMDLLLAIFLMILTSSLWASDCGNKRNKKLHCPVSSDINKIALKPRPKISIQKCKCLLEQKINFRKLLGSFQFVLTLYRKRVGIEVDKPSSCAMAALASGHPCYVRSLPSVGVN